MAGNEALQLGIPVWLREGLNQYLELGGEKGIIRQPGTPYDHLSGFVMHHALRNDGEWASPAHEEVVSDVLYVPEASKPAGSRLLLGKDDIFIAQSLFTFGAPHVEARFKLGIQPVRGQSREVTMKALIEETETLTSSRDVGPEIIVIDSGIRGEGDEARVVKPTVQERQGAKLQQLPGPSQAATAVLRLFMVPELAPEIKRARMTRSRFGLHVLPS